MVSEIKSSGCKESASLSAHFLRFIVALCFTSVVAGCVSMAAPSPLATFGGSRGDKGTMDLNVNGRYQLTDHVRPSAQGYPGNIIGGGPDNGTPPNDFLLVAAVGASGGFGETGRFVGERGKQTRNFIAQRTATLQIGCLLLSLP